MAEYRKGSEPDKRNEREEVDCALSELTLYLDTHPLDMQVMEQFRRLTLKREQLAGRTNSVSGSLFEYGPGFNRFPWEGTAAPWYRFL